MTQDETVSSVNAEPVESVENTSVAPVVDTTTKTTPSTTEAPAKAKTVREVASEVYDKLAANQEQPNTDASKGKTDHTPAKAMPVLPGAKAEATPTATPEVDPVSGKPIEAIKAPASWTPNLREKWSTVPRDIQKFIIDREREMTVTLDKTASERKAAKEWAESTSPYADFCKQFNTTPVAHAKELLDMSRALNTGNPQQKAQILHNLIMHFKPDFAVMQALSQGRAVNIPAQQAPQAPVDIKAEVEKWNAREAAERQEAEAQAVIETFASDPAHEFYGDVQGLMGKAIEAGFVQGGSTEEVLKNAYAFACAQHPEVKSILASRQAVTPAVVQTRPSVQAVRSVKPSLGAGAQTKVTKVFKTRREAVEAAYEALDIK